MDSTPVVAAKETLRPERAGKRLKSIGYFSAFVGLGMVGAVLGPTLPYLAEHTGAHLSQISYLFTARSLGYLTGSVFGGRGYDRVAGHPLIGIALLALAAATAAVPLIPALWALALLMVFLGIAEGTVDVGGNTMLVWVHHPKTGPYMNALHFFFGFGSFLAPIIIAQLLLLTGDILWPYWAIALFIVPAALYLLRLPSPSSLKVSGSSSAGRANPLLVGLLALFFFLIVGAEISFGGWIFTYSVRLSLANETTGAYLTSLFWGSFTLGRLVGIPITMRVRARYVLLGDVTGALAGLLVILLFPDPGTGVWIGTAIYGISMASVFPTLISFAEHRMALTGRITSYFFVGASLGGMFFPWLIGQLFESAGPRMTMITILVDMFAALGIYALLIIYSSRLSSRQAHS